MMIRSLFAGLLLLTACSSKPKETVVSEAPAAAAPAAADSAVYTVETGASTLAWEGYEGLALLDSEHNGTIRITGGHLATSGGTLSGGLFTVDMNSIEILDIPKEKTGYTKLLKHLKSDDFFETEKHPVAQFEITGVEAASPDSARVTGNLTIKGTARSITFPARVAVTDSTLSASARFFINRKEWGIVYRSEESLGNKMIRPEIGFTVSIAARR